MLKRILAAVIVFCLAVCSLTGCKDKTKNDNDITDPSEPDIPASAESLKDTVSILRSEIDTLDNTLHGWGQGTAVDEDNCPICSVDFNRQYGEYDALFGGNKDVGKTVYLTFDEGYENGYTQQILDTLKEKNCSAIFFVTMDYIKNEPELIRRMINEGHIVGNHSANHPSMPSLSASEAAAEITELHDYVLKEFGYQMFLFRPPKGEFSVRTLAVTQDLGYTSVFWSFAYKDWITDDQPEQTAALNRMVSSVHDGAIYLLHAVSATNTAVLGDFIDKIRQKGYEFSTQL